MKTKLAHSETRTARGFENQRTLTKSSGTSKKECIHANTHTQKRGGEKKRINTPVEAEEGVLIADPSDPL